MNSELHIKSWQGSCLLRFMNFTGIKYVLVIISLGINCRHISRLRKNMRYPILPSRPHIRPLKERDIFTFRSKGSIVD